ncbi:uncharacterized protein BT62DRAFT_1003599 [Guyanagaster necrorhizus]|uniref:Uncharacterized protein n=1 Tax=Guyanagaster necrorhizus TaxID=856835 RepID=A0A9P8AUV9_9AGAR|nr:uncharacterized protein BT62DRAFT_1003599 [Guyanagaster necrorhizus MCA 3950]KAG7448878.1 hypothetical protein BT62DRAFT_1003599 [Guyanagaster necrorhizus MCA 3950]
MSHQTSPSMTSLPLSETPSDTPKKQKMSLGARLKGVLGKRRSSSGNTSIPQGSRRQSSETLETLGLQGFDEPNPTPPSPPLSTASLHQEQLSPSLKLGTRPETLWMPFRWLQAPEAPQEAVEGEQENEIHYWQAVSRAASRLEQEQGGAPRLPRHSPVVPNPIQPILQSLAEFINTPNSPFQKPATSASSPDSWTRPIARIVNADDYYHWQSPLLDEDHPLSYRTDTITKTDDIPVWRDRIPSDFGMIGGQLLLSFFVPSSIETSAGITEQWCHQQKEKRSSPTESLLLDPDPMTLSQVLSPNLPTPETFGQQSSSLLEGTTNKRAKGDDEAEEEGQGDQAVDPILEWRSIISMITCQEQEKKR